MDAAAMGIGSATGILGAGAGAPPFVAATGITTPQTWHRARMPPTGTLAGSTR
jgi:hypothetical protein